MTSPTLLPMNFRSAAGCCCRAKDRSGAASSSAMAMADARGRTFDIPVKETAVLFPCFRGISRSRRAPISSDPQWHVLTDIDKPQRYILGGCVEDLWLAVSALTELYPELDGRIGYTGMSFGGGIGALALAFDKRIDRGHLTVPTFGNMPLWLTLPTLGSGHSVQNYQKTHRDVLKQTLALFDAATAATRIEVPMLVAVARFDPAWPRPASFRSPMRCRLQIIKKLSSWMQAISTILAARSSTRSSQKKSDNSSGRHAARVSTLAQSGASARHGAFDLRPCRSQGVDVSDPGWALLGIRAAQHRR